MDYETVQKLYADYVDQKLGAGSSEKATPFWAYDAPDGRLSMALKAVGELQMHYDYCLAVARDGLWLGFIFEFLEVLPVLTVRVKRRGCGAIWKPVDSLACIHGKRVLVLDNDVVTGRTLKRVARELQLVGVAIADLLLVYDYTLVAEENFQKWEHMMGESYDHLGRVGGNLALSCLAQVKPHFGRVRTLDDFGVGSRTKNEFERRVSAIAMR